jgi:DNA-binding beta-propeller fold protein YncE
VEIGGNGGPAHFIFANLNGTISAWDMGATAFIQVTTPGANYSGLAINQAQTQLYAASQTGAGSIDVFNSSFGPVSLAAGAFATPQAEGGVLTIGSTSPICRRQLGS